MAHQASWSNPDGSTTLIVCESKDIAGTVGGPVRHGEDTHPADAGLRTVTSLLHDFPRVVTDATEAVRRREHRRTVPMFSGDDAPTARLPRFIATASAPLAARS